jgi:DNA-binding transcriptional MerR regulator
MKNMTLREVCDTFNVSRRAVQGYEKAGLVAATGKNERGYLLYDEEMQARIKKIKLYQQMGFSLKEVREIIDASDSILKTALEKQVKKLEKERDKSEMLIEQARRLIEDL